MKPNEMFMSCVNCGQTAYFDEYLDGFLCQHCDTLNQPHRIRKASNRNTKIRPDGAYDPHYKCWDVTTHRTYEVFDSSDINEENGYKRYIQCENNGVFYSTMEDCCLDMNVPKAELIKCLEGKQGHYRDMCFRYAWQKEHK